VTLEVGRVELAPQSPLRLLGDRVEPQQTLRLDLACFDAVGDRALGATAREDRPRRMEQVFQELRFPGVPHARARAANVGYRQEVERDEPAFRRDPTRKRGDDARVRDVLFLRRHRHRQMLGDEPGHQLDVLDGEPVLD